MNIKFFLVEKYHQKIVRGLLRMNSPLRAKYSYLILDENRNYKMRLIGQGNLDASGAYLILNWLGPQSMERTVGRSSFFYMIRNIEWAGERRFL